MTAYRLAVGLLLAASELLMPSRGMGQACRAAEADSLFRAHALSFLARPLWRGVDMYGATHLLLVPLTAAYDGVFPGWQPAFERHFGRFARAHPRGLLRGEPLWRAHYLFLASEFAIRNRTADPALRPSLLASVRRLWLEEPLRLFGAGPYAGVAGRLRARAGRSGYRGAIDDLDRLTIAAVANLRAAPPADPGEPVPGWLDSALVVADSVLRARVEWQPGGGWLFQPGAWADHPDMRYAGSEAPRPPRRPAPVPTQAEDVSHSMRWPAILRALERAARVAGTPTPGFVDSLRTGLTSQMSDVVLIRPGADFPGWRTTNFMDGRNGWYRVRTAYHAAGPHELSVALLFGWWVLLDAPVTDSLYLRLASDWPFAPTVRAVYERAQADTVPGNRAGITSQPLRTMALFAAGCLAAGPA